MPVGKPDAGNQHVRFDERGRETERAPQSTATAPVLDSTNSMFVTSFECRLIWHSLASIGHERHPKTGLTFGVRQLTLRSLPQPDAHPPFSSMNQRLNMAPLNVMFACTRPSLPLLPRRLSRLPAGSLRRDDRS